MDRKLGLVVFSSHTGLGNQSRRLAQFMKPERILLIDNSSFSPNKEQHPDWYEGFSGFVASGIPNMEACKRFLDGLTHLYIIENPLNWNLITLAHRRGIKTYIASNYEFCDNLDKPHLPLPDVFLMPSHWKVEEMKHRFGADKVKYLPPPVFPEDFAKVREKNWSRKGKRRYLHTVGTLAVADRNGTLILLEALKHTNADFDLVIKSQHTLPPEYQSKDHRIFYNIGSNPEVSEIYNDFDALIMPRKFGGLCLPVQEALMAGMPVIMPDISPNTETLPENWLIRATKTGSIKTRIEIDLYEANPVDLARKIEEFTNMNDEDLEKAKIDAFDIAHKEYAPSSLRGEYEKLWQ